MTGEEQRASLAEALLLVGVATRATGSLEERLTPICQTMTEILGCDRSSVFLSDGDQFLPIANHGNPPDIAKAFPRSRIDARRGLMRRTMTSALPIHVPDAATAPDLIHPELVVAARLRSVITARLLSGATPVGVITAEFNETNSAFGDFDSVVVQGLAQIASLVIEEHATRGRELELLAEIQHRAEHDELTDLPNRRALATWFDNLGTTAEPDSLAAVLLADLDRFKVVNDALGHASGDRLLIAVADRFRDAFAGVDVQLCRFGGDEFVVCAIVRDQTQAEQFAEVIAEALREPIAVSADQALVVTASVGIAVSTVRTLKPDVLLSDADAAMYVAKDLRRGRSVLASSDHRPVVSHRFALEVSLARALDEHEITPWYQPIIDLRTGRCVAMEALARWHHPERGVLPPSAFLTSVAEMGLLRRLTDCILAQSAEHMRSDSVDGLALFVNHSVADIDDALGTRLHSAFDEPNRIVVELTERDAMQQGADVGAILRDLRASGMRVALDDFGTGFSSLSMLAELPLDIVKIDRTLIKGVVDPRAVETVRATVQLGAALGLTVLAEGVEDDDERRALVDAEVDLAQGYLLARPMRFADLEAALAAGDLRV